MAFVHQQQQQQPGLIARVCNALDVNDVAALVPLLLALHVITLGASTAAILAAAGTTCALAH